MVVMVAGPSVGADREVEVVRSKGDVVFTGIEEIEPCGD